MYRVLARGAVVVFRRSEVDPNEAGTGDQRRRFFVLARGTRAITFNRRPAAGATVGTATEVDSAFALARLQIRTIGLATEADLALALAPRSLRAVGLASEADSALALGAVQIRATGAAVETDTAFGLSAPGSGAVGVALEQDSAFALAGLQLRVVGISLEADSAIARPVVQIRAAGLASEADAALALTYDASNPVLTADGGAYVLTGSDATLIYSGERSNTGAGSNKRRRRERYVVKHGDRYEVFSSPEAMEAYVEAAQAVEAPRPKKQRRPIRIELAPAFAEEVAAVTAAPKFNDKAPPSVALDQVRRLEKRLLELARRREEEDEDDEVLLWLM